MAGTHTGAPAIFASDAPNSQATNTSLDSGDQENKSNKEAPAEVDTVEVDNSSKKVSSEATAEEPLVAPTSPVVVDLETRKPPESDHSQDGSGKKDDVLTMSESDGKRKSDTDLAGTSDTVPVKKQKLKGQDLWDAMKSIDRVTTLKHNVEQGALKFCDDVAAAFDSNNLPPAPKKINCKPGAPLQLPESACANTKFSFQQIITGLKDLQALASAEEFDQQAFIEKLKSSLEGWEGFFSSYFTLEITRMVSRLKGLQTKLENESVQQSQESFEDLTARSQRVTEMLEQASSIRGLIVRARTKIERVRSAGAKDQESLAIIESEHKKGIRDLEAQLAEKKEDLELIKVMKLKNAEFFEEANAATQVVEESSSRFEEITARGDAMSKNLEAYSQKIENVEGLPRPLHALRTVKSYSIIE